MLFYCYTMPQLPNACYGRGEAGTDQDRDVDVNSILDSSRRVVRENALHTTNFIALASVFVQDDRCVGGASWLVFGGELQINLDRIAWL